tara:strand:- start:341 stop:868 length:528 start_codon:yes stop_codon:yes gene_type:complete
MNHDNYDYIGDMIKRKKYVKQLLDIYIKEIDKPIINKNIETNDSDEDDISLSDSDDDQEYYVNIENNILITPNGEKLIIKKQEIESGEIVLLASNNNIYDLKPPHLLRGKYNIALNNIIRDNVKERTFRELLIEKRENELYYMPSKQFDYLLIKNKMVSEDDIELCKELKKSSFN